MNTRQHYTGASAGDGLMQTYGPSMSAEQWADLGTSLNSVKGSAAGDFAVSVHEHARPFCFALRSKDQGHPVDALLVGCLVLILALPVLRLLQHRWRDFKAIPAFGGDAVLPLVVSPLLAFCLLAWRPGLWPVPLVAMLVTMSVSLLGFLRSPSAERRNRRWRLWLEASLVVGLFLLCFCARGASLGVWVSAGVVCGAILGILLLSIPEPRAWFSWPGAHNALLVIFLITAIASIAAACWLARTPEATIPLAPLMVAAPAADSPVTRLGVQEVTAQLLSPIPGNRFGVLFHLLWLYIAMGIIALFVWITGYKPTSNSERVFSLVKVVCAYLAFGVAFAAIFYLLYGGELAPYNRWALEAVRAYAIRARQEAGQLEHLDRIGWAQEGERLRRQILERNWEDAPSLNRYLDGMWRKALGCAVFAEDTPHSVLLHQYNDRPKSIFRGTLQFDHAVEHVVDGTTGALTQVSGRRTLTSNSSVLAEWGSSVAKHLSEKPVAGEHYSVSLVAGASAAWRGQKPDRNKDVAERRCAEVRDLLRNRLDRPSAPGLRNPRQEQLLRALEGAQEEFRVQREQHQRPSDHALWALWPAATSDTNDPIGGTDALWRVVAVHVDEVVPDSLTGLDIQMGLSETVDFRDMLYFSFVSFTTTGYGDIRPVGSGARFYVVLENILEIIFTAMFFTTAMRHKDL